VRFARPSGPYSDKSSAHTQLPALLACKGLSSYVIKCHFLPFPDMCGMVSDIPYRKEVPDAEHEYFSA
jgi:hypothetical protein